MPYRIRDRRWCVLLLLIAGIVGVVWYLLPERRRPDAEILDEARAAVQGGRFDEAADLIGDVLERNPDSVTARRLAFELAVEQRDPDAALRHLKGMSNRSRLDAIPALEKWGDRSVQAGRLSRAARLFKAIHSIDRTHVVAHDRLAAIMALQGRRQDAEPHVRELIRQSRATIGHLLIVAYGKTEFNFAALNATAGDDVDDAGTQLALALAALRENQAATAAKRLARAVRLDPGLSQAQARLGLHWLDQGNLAKFDEWRSQLPPEIQVRSEIWYVRGRAAEQRRDAPTAVRCFWEACRGNPDSIAALTHLIRQLAAVDEGSRTGPFRERLALLDRLAQVAAKINDQRDNIEYLRTAATTSEQLQRYWEAAGWWRVISLHPEHVAEARRHIERLQPFLQPRSEAQPLAANPAARIDLSGYPLNEPDGRAKSVQFVLKQPAEGDVAFRDDAASAGLRFRFQNGMNRDIGMRMYEFTGGGIGVVDFDADGWPDVALTQGGSLVSPTAPPHDKLFRNTGDGRFVDVTSKAKFGGRLYGQGVAVGDVDQDGLPDVFVANIGRNQLFRNNGDGTFTDVTAGSGIAGERWSTSCVIADFSGDGLPDIYVVNYLADRSAYVKLCQWFENADKKPPNCSPNRFASEQDRLYLNLGDGTFRDVTETSGIAVANGKGLGVVAADFEGTGRLNLFVANDGVANFYFRNSGKHAPLEAWWSERALLAGAAYDNAGSPQACMGIAAEDLDGNGLIDLFVTNFYKESNTLYLQSGAGAFEDATRRWNLRNPSFLMLGFGTQFLDADSDGAPDLVVANGHLTEVGGTPYRMHTQIFRNRGPDRFEEVAGGSFFRRKILGRALARLDWNRDGRDDFIVLPLDTNLALLTNTSTTRNHTISIDLRARHSSRDAVGTRVVLESGDRRWVKQLTAGDGYQVSNQRRLVVGLGERKQVDRVTVEWMSGTRDVYRGLRAGREYLMVEGDAIPRELPR